MAPPSLDVRFLENKRGGMSLVINGCKYRINRRSGTTCYWRCFYRFCRANAVVEGGKLKSAAGEHTCQQPFCNRGAPAEVRRRHRHHQETNSVTLTQANKSNNGISSESSLKMSTRAHQSKDATRSGGSKVLRSKSLQQKATNNSTTTAVAARRKSTANNHRSEDANDKTTASSNSGAVENGRSRSHSASISSDLSNNKINENGHARPSSPRNKQVRVPAANFRIPNGPHGA